MILGMDAFTFVHTALSLIGIATGFVVLYGFLSDHRFDGWTAVFLFTTLATSVTGFGFPFVELLPSHIVGIVSLVVLFCAVYARYGAKLLGVWRPVYIASATAALYLNVFVLIVQLFVKVPALTALAPTQSELPFVAAQGATLLAFLALGYRATRRFHGSLASA